MQSISQCSDLGRHRTHYDVTVMGERVLARASKCVQIASDFKMFEINIAAQISHFFRTVYDVEGLPLAPFHAPS